MRKLEIWDIIFIASVLFSSYCPSSFGLPDYSMQKKKVCRRKYCDECWKSALNRIRTVEDGDK